MSGAVKEVRWCGSRMCSSILSAPLHAPHCCNTYVRTFADAVRHLWMLLSLDSLLGMLDWLPARQHATSSITAALVLMHLSSHCAVTNVRPCAGFQILVQLHTWQLVLLARAVRTSRNNLMLHVHAWPEFANGCMLSSTRVTFPTWSFCATGQTAHAWPCTHGPL